MQRLLVPFVEPGKVPPTFISPAIGHGIVLLALVSNAHTAKLPKQETAPQTAGCAIGEAAGLRKALNAMREAGPKRVLGRRRRGNDARRGVRRLRFRGL
jgi:hypothetical protein